MQTLTWLWTHASSSCSRWRFQLLHLAAQGLIHRGMFAQAGSWRPSDLCRMKRDQDVKQCKSKGWEKVDNFSSKKRLKIEPNHTLSHDLFDAFFVVLSHSCFLVRTPSMTPSSPAGLGRSKQEANINIFVANRWSSIKSNEEKKTFLSCFRVISEAIWAPTHWTASDIWRWKLRKQ